LRGLPPDRPPEPPRRRGPPPARAPPGDPAVHEVGRLYSTGEESVRVPLTQEDLAGLAGATRPTVNAALRRLEQDDVVRLRRGGVEILDVRALRQRC
ncbi:MAG: helix-turn-helix domain-containing protein, partial [Propionibacteriaceae bacterium]